MTSTFKFPVIIIGGGLVGLALAQALTNRQIPCVVYERDAALEDERGGWAITIHWGLDYLYLSMPSDIYDRLDDIQVDPEQGRNDTGRFLFLNMATAVPKYEIPPSHRRRVNRRLLRDLLAEGVDIRYGKRFSSFERKRGNETVIAHFEDGGSVEGSLLIACDGSNSRVRRALYQDNPAEAELYQLPVRAMGVTTRMTEEQVKPLRQIDPLLFQGCHPETGVFLWYSTVSTPPINGSESTSDPYYEGQLIMSWLHKSAKEDVPDTDVARLQKMREMAMPFEKRLKTAINEIPEDAEIKEIKLQDWATRPWPHSGDLVTLAGDAAHAMTMYRGEAFNHGVRDVFELCNILTRVRDGEISVQYAIRAYDQELMQRTRMAVLLSRAACLDAHDFHALNNDSPLVSKRAQILEPGKLVGATEAVQNGDAA